MHFTRQFQGRDWLKLQLCKSKYWHICKSKCGDWEKISRNSKNLILHFLCEKGIQKGGKAVNNEGASAKHGTAGLLGSPWTVFMLPGKQSSV